MIVLMSVFEPSRNVAFHVPSSQMLQIMSSYLYATNGSDQYHSGNMASSSQSQNSPFFFTDTQAPSYDDVHQEF